VIWVYASRFTADMGIGGEYAAINSAIDEMILERFRGHVDIAINGTYWGDALLGTLAELYILNHFSDTVSWRLGFLLGPVLTVAIIFVRCNLPESPRWLVMHGREKKAAEAIKRMEQESASRGGLPLLDESNALVINPIADLGYFTLARALFTQMPKRSILGATLMITQSFLYNAIFFTYALVLSSVYHISTGSILLYFIAFTVGNLAGPILLGKLFDTIGRRFMISSTCLLASILLAFIAWAFDANLLDALTQTIAWSLVFFFAIAQAFGALGPNIYGGLANKHRGLLFSYLVGAGVMIIGGVAELVFGVAAEQQSLEEIAIPLSAVGNKTGGGSRLRYDQDSPAADRRCLSTRNASIHRQTMEERMISDANRWTAYLWAARTVSDVRAHR
jgi:MFS family permease